MKASTVKIKDLNTWEELDDARSDIENDYLNVVGGMKAWCSGYETKLTVGAQLKIQQIENKIDRLDQQLIS